MGHALMENRNGLVVDQRLTHATGKAEREAAIEMLAAQPGATPKTVGADKGYDTADFVADCRAIGVTPHVAQNTKNRASAIDERTTFGPARMMWGRDTAVSAREGYGNALRLTLEQFAARSAEDRALVFGQVALRLFPIR